MFYLKLIGIDCLTFPVWYMLWHLTDYLVLHVGERLHPSRRSLPPVDITDRIPVKLLVTADRNGLVDRPINVQVYVQGIHGIYPTGSVSLYKNNVLLGGTTKPLKKGRASWTLTAQNEGRHFLTVRYSGDDQCFDQAESEPAIVDIEPRKVR